MSLSIAIKVFNYLYEEALLHLTHVEILLKVGKNKKLSLLFGNRQQKYSQNCLQLSERQIYYEETRMIWRNKQTITRNHYGSFVTNFGGPTVTIVLHVCHIQRAFSPTSLSLFGKICSCHSPASHLNPNFCKVLFLHS